MLPERSPNGIFQDKVLPVLEGLPKELPDELNAEGKERVMRFGMILNQEAGVEVAWTDMQDRSPLPDRWVPERYTKPNNHTIINAYGALLRGILPAERFIPEEAPIFDTLAIAKVGRRYFTSYRENNGIWHPVRNDRMFVAGNFRHIQKMAEKALAEQAA